MRNLLIASVLLFISQLCYSQDLTAARVRATEKTSEMKNDLGLTQDQESKVLALNIELEEELEILKSNTNLSKTERSAQVESLAGKEKERLKSILSTEQFDLFYSSNEPSKAKINTSRSSIKKN